MISWPSYLPHYNLTRFSILCIYRGIVYAQTTSGPLEYCYVHTSISQRLLRTKAFCPINIDLQLRAYYNSHSGNYPIACRSLTGSFISLGHSPIFWKKKKQHMFSRSFAESEYQSMAVTYCELKWL